MSLNTGLKAAARASAAAAFVLLCLFDARAQEETSLTPPKVEVKVTAGGAVFALEDADSAAHTAAGGAVRVYLSKRWSVEPEFMYMRRGANDQDYFFTPSVAYDFVPSTRKVVPYAIAGVGVERHTGRFVGADFTTGVPFVVDTSYTTWSVGVGVGVKLHVTGRLYVAPEVRVGREPYGRATVSVGYVLSGRKRR
ncbi:MAG TPA: outer membrane beta-barrel protein [Pyrinomonadaceae bacterium]|nr:outer membrane beta-barrel protein [Pyrinomonadaceae bacterium]